MISRLNDVDIGPTEQFLDQDYLSCVIPLDGVTGKLQQAEQAAGQALLQELSPKVQEVLRELITTEGIGLLLQRASVIHADAGYSITAKVTDKLNQLPAQ